MRQGRLTEKKEEKRGKRRKVPFFEEKPDQTKVIAHLRLQRGEPK